MKTLAITAERFAALVNGVKNPERYTNQELAIESGPNFLLHSSDELGEVFAVPIGRLSKSCVEKLYPCGLP